MKIIIIIVSLCWTYLLYRAIEFYFIDLSAITSSRERIASVEEAYICGGLDDDGYPIKQTDSINFNNSEDLFLCAYINPVEIATINLLWKKNQDGVFMSGPDYIMTEKGWVFFSLLDEAGNEESNVFFLQDSLIDGYLPPDTYFVAIQQLREIIAEVEFVVE